MAMSNSERQRKFRENRDKDLEKRGAYLLSERQRYKRDNESGKKGSTKELPARERRSLRRKWRKQKADQKERAKVAEQRIENLVTPPMSPEAPQFPREAESRQKSQHLKTVNKQKAKCYRDNTVLQRELEKANRKVLMYKKRMDRIKNKNTGETPRKKTRSLLRNISKTTVRKTLLFHTVLLDQMRTWYKEKKRHVKRDLATMLSGPILKKYKFKSAAWQACGIQTRSKQNKQSPNHLSLREKRSIRNFYERDDVSRLMTGTKRTVTYKKQTKQRRVLTDTLKHSYLKYTSEGNTSVSFTTFYRLRPFWVIFPKPSDRSTCLCKLCENIQFMLSALKASKAIESDSVDNFVGNVACDIKSQTCMHGNCTTCRSVRVPYDKTTKDNEIQWAQWITKTEMRKIKKNKSEVEKEVSYTVKQTYNGSVMDLLEWLDKSIDRYKKHHFNIRNQYEYFRERRGNLMNNECIIHVDFSENYVCKYSKEIQSMHFGASKKQLSLHTGVYYVGQDKQQTFCTVTEDLNHGPGAIWAHMKPVLSQIAKTYPQVDSLEFFSDGPTAQYRQKGNFFLLTTQPKEFGFENTAWSFFEAGHGKGVPDAVGGAVKRKADTYVKYGKDITSGEDFIKALSDSTVDCYLIPVEDICQGVRAASSQRLQAVKGTLNLHQVCSISEGVVSYRDTSCSCRYPNECPEHKLKKANLSLRQKLTSTLQTQTMGATSKPKKLSQPNMNANVSKKRSVKRRKMQPERSNFDIILEEMEMCTTYEMLQTKCEEIEKRLEPMNKVSESVSFTTQPLEPDVEAMDMIPSDLPDQRTLYACQVDADGNCLPSCGSVHAFGCTSGTSEIRARIVCELVLNEERYLSSRYLSRGTEENPQKPKNWPYLYTQYSDVYVPGIHLSDEIVQYFFRCEVLKVRKNKSFMGMWQLHALAEVLNMPVYSVYPELGATCVRRDYHRLLLPSTDENCTDTPVYILWTSTRVDMNKEHWIPNHFVPLIPIEPMYVEVMRTNPEMTDDDMESENAMVENCEIVVEKNDDVEAEQMVVEVCKDRDGKKYDVGANGVVVERSESGAGKNDDVGANGVVVERSESGAGKNDDVGANGVVVERSESGAGKNDDVGANGVVVERSESWAGKNDDVGANGVVVERSESWAGKNDDVGANGEVVERSESGAGKNDDFEANGMVVDRSESGTGKNDDLEANGMVVERSESGAGKNDDFGTNGMVVERNESGAGKNDDLEANGMVVERSESGAGKNDDLEANGMVVEISEVEASKNDVVKVECVVVKSCKIGIDKNKVVEAASGVGTDKINHFKSETDMKGEVETEGVMVKRCEDGAGKIEIEQEIEGYKLKIPSPERCIGKYVVVDFNQVPYPGHVSDASETHVLVECMHRTSKLEKNDFFWPKKRKDIEWYDHDNIMALIPEPQQIKNTSHFEVQPVAWNEILELFKSMN